MHRYNFFSQSGPAKRIAPRPGILGVVLGVLIGFSSQVFAADPSVVMVIFSSRAGPYDEAWRGFNEFLSSTEIPATFTSDNLQEEHPEEILSSLTEHEPDLVFTLGAKASRLARDHIKDTPVVFGMVFDPSEFRRDRMTGVSLKIPAVKKLKEVSQMLPEAKKVGTIYSPNTIGAYQEVKEAITGLGLQLVDRKVDSQKDFPDALGDLLWKVDYFFMIPDPTIYSLRSVEHLLREGLKERVPVIGLSSTYTKAGALASIDCDYRDLGKQAGDIAFRILTGVNTENIEPTFPRSVHVSLNLTVAERLEIKIPPRAIRNVQDIYGK